MQRLNYTLVVLVALFSTAVASARPLTNVEGVADVNGSFGGAPRATFRFSEYGSGGMAGSAHYGSKALSRFQISGSKAMQYSPRELQHSVSGRRGFWNICLLIKRLLVPYLGYPDKEVQSVPEPGAMALLGMGLMLMGGSVAVRRRRRI